MTRPAVAPADVQVDGTALEAARRAVLVTVAQCKNRRTLLHTFPPRVQAREIAYDAVRVYLAATGRDR